MKFLVLFFALFLFGCNGGDNKAGRVTVTGPNVNVSCQDTRGDQAGDVTIATDIDCTRDSNNDNSVNEESASE